MYIINSDIEKSIFHIMNSSNFEKQNLIPSIILGTYKNSFIIRLNLIYIMGKDIHHCNKERVFKSNLEIHNLKLVFQSFGNASGRNGSKCLIKPSGVKMSEIVIENIVSVNINDINDIDINLNPSSDTPTHIVLYENFNSLGGVVHTHSLYATAWAQSGLPIPCLGTTHADYWNGEIPITRNLTDKEIQTDYEHNTGLVIIEKIKDLCFNPLDCPGILVANHGPFAWGKNIEEAVKHAELLEFIAKQAWIALSINSNAKPISDSLLKKHFSRKHGPNAYYGQNKET
jgi:L-ribulose-5-phosphate 4-epimerase